MIIPHYLEQKLAAIELDDFTLLHEQGYLEIFAQLKLAHPSLSYQTLFDLFALCQGCPRYNLSPELKQELVVRYKSLPPRHHRLEMTTIHHFLNLAQTEAKLALTVDEIPIGAVVVQNSQVIGAGHNQTRRDNNILHHAEIMAISAAQNSVGNYRLSDCDLYVTIEPCLMCAGAIINSRIRRLIYGATEPKTGACHSQYRVFDNKESNHHCQVIGPVDSAQYGQMITQFLRSK